MPCPHRLRARYFSTVFERQCDSHELLIQLHSEIAGEVQEQSRHDTLGSERPLYTEIITTITCTRWSRISMNNNRDPVVFVEISCDTLQAVCTLSSNSKHYLAPTHITLTSAASAAGTKQLGAGGCQVDDLMIQLKQWKGLAVRDAHDHLAHLKSMLPLVLCSTTRLPGIPAQYEQHTVVHRFLGLSSGMATTTSQSYSTPTVSGSRTMIF